MGTFGKVTLCIFLLAVGICLALHAVFDYRDLILGLLAIVAAVLILWSK